VPDLRRFSFAQRIALLIGLGFAFLVIGSYLVSLGGPGADFGSFGYAPLSSSFVQQGADLSTFEQLLVWLGLIAVWSASALWVLSPSEVHHDDPT